MRSHSFKLVLFKPIRLATTLILGFLFVEHFLASYVAQAQDRIPTTEFLQVADITSGKLLATGEWDLDGTQSIGDSSVFFDRSEEAVGHFWKLEATHSIQFKALLPQSTTAVKAIEIDVFGVPEGASKVRVKVAEGEWLDLQAPPARELARLSVSAAELDSEAGIDGHLATGSSIDISLASVEGIVAIQAVRVLASRPAKMFQFDWGPWNGDADPSRIALLAPGVGRIGLTGEDPAVPVRLRAIRTRRYERFRLMANLLDGSRRAIFGAPPVLFDEAVVPNEQESGLRPVEQIVRLPLAPARFHKPREPIGPFDLNVESYFNETPISDLLSISDPISGRGYSQFRGAKFQLSRDGKFLIALSSEQVNVFSIQSGKQVADWHTGRVFRGQFALLPEQTKCARLENDGSGTQHLVVNSVATGQELSRHDLELAFPATIEEEGRLTSGINSARFSGDGRRLIITTSREGTHLENRKINALRSIDTESGEVIENHTFLGSIDLQARLRAVSSDGSLVILSQVADEDTEAQLVCWNVAERSVRWSRAVGDVSQWQVFEMAPMSQRFVLRIQDPDGESRLQVLNWNSGQASTTFAPELSLGPGELLDVKTSRDDQQLLVLHGGTMDASSVSLAVYQSANGARVGQISLPPLVDRLSSGQYWCDFSADGKAVLFVDTIGGQILHEWELPD